jgi:hypothetical protein
MLLVRHWYATTSLLEVEDLALTAAAVVAAEDFEHSHQHLYLIHTML